MAAYRRIVLLDRPPQSILQVEAVKARPPAIAQRGKSDIFAIRRPAWIEIAARYGGQRGQLAAIVIDDKHPGARVRLPVADAG